MSEIARTEIGEGGVCPQCEVNELKGPVVGMSPNVKLPLLGKQKFKVQLCPTCSRVIGQELINKADEAEMLRRNR